MKTLSIIIVNYNVKYFLEQALRSALKGTEGIDAEIFVVDNNSVDGSAEIVRSKFPSVLLIENRENLGYARANNQAIRLAQGKYILLLNPDTVIEEDTCGKCIAFMDAHPDAGGLGVKMIDGKGNFLPESKRAFPSPEVAFYKAFGLASLFPHSRVFGKYHLGYLSPDAVHTVGVLAGAFMMLRKSVLDSTGLLDETFFMYGEDIDLSYRIVQVGYKNYYFPGTMIIHYKGESTKRGSLNYVRMFYSAMEIFARKHFSQSRAGFFSFLIRFAIFVRSLFAVLVRFGRKAALPALDAVLIFAGMYLIKEYWEYYIKYIEGGKYPSAYLFVNVPLYIAIWVLSIFFSGGYDRNANVLKILRGIFWGTLIISALYGFMPEALRFSRGMIIAGAAWVTFSIITTRVMIHFLRFGNFRFGQTPGKKIIIAGNTMEAERVIRLLQSLQLGREVLGYVKIDDDGGESEWELGDEEDLREIIGVYKANELIFCSRDIPSARIMEWMVKLGPALDYKIIPDRSMSIIGSNSKNTAGDLYSLDITLRINMPSNIRNKRFIDICTALLCILFSPLLILFLHGRKYFLNNCFAVLTGRKSFVGYAEHEGGRKQSLPPLRKGVLSPLDSVSLQRPDAATIDRLNMLYARDYSPAMDIAIILKNIRGLGRGPAAIRHGIPLETVPQDKG